MDNDIEVSVEFIFRTSGVVILRSEDGSVSHFVLGEKMTLTLKTKELKRCKKRNDRSS